MSRASSDLADLIHGLVADGLRQDLERAISARDDQGNPVPINPQLIDKALKFLKDNGVDAPASSPRVDLLAQKLGELDLDDEAVRLRPN